MENLTDETKLQILRDARIDETTIRYLRNPDTRFAAAFGMVRGILENVFEHVELGPEWNNAHLRFNALKTFLYS